MSNKTIEMRAVAQLKVHPAVSNLPALSDDEFAAGLQGVRDHGIIQPLTVTPAGLVVDGRHRLRWAQAAGIAQVPCEVRSVADDAEVIAIALRTLIDRRHYTPGQLALVAYPVLKDAHEAARQAKSQVFSANARALSQKGFTTCLPAAAGSEESSTCGNKTATIRQICAGFGFSEDSFLRAARLFEIFEATDDLQLQWQQDIIEDAGLEEGRAYTAREVFWPRLMRRQSPLGLGQAIAGLCGRPEIDELLNEAKRGKSKKGGRPQDDEVGVTGLRKQLELFSETWSKDIRTRGKYWAKFAPEERKTALSAIDEGLHEVPEDFLAALKKRVNAEIKRRKKGASL